MKKLLLLTMLTFCWAYLVQAQSIVVGSAADQYLRFLQLTNQSTERSGLVNRPFTVLGPDKDSILAGMVTTPLRYKYRKNISAGIMPLALDQQYVSHHPYWQNDGSMIPAKGYQTRASAGLYGNLGPLRIQINPEWVYAAHSTYRHNSVYGSTPKPNYTKVFPGQSAVRLVAGPVGISAATENLWWGPGYHHSLVMSNQAPGFPHLKFHSTKPLRTPIGSFEWTLMGARLTSDKSMAYDNYQMQFIDTFVPANRYLSAYTITFSPRFLPGLSLGLNRGLQQYHVDVDASNANVLRKYLPVIFKPVQKKNATDDDAQTTDQVAAAFFRWLLKKSKAEIYGEFGFNDYKVNIRDYMLNLPHSAAYLVGFKKAIPVGAKEYVEAGVEITQLRQSVDRIVRTAGNWYVHGKIGEGYTHQNQVIGAAYASNAQTLQVAHWKGLQRTSFTLQRFQRDPDYSANLWTDFVVGLSRSQMYKGFLLDGQFQVVHSKNYAWENHSNPVHIITKVGLRYYFHD